MLGTILGMGARVAGTEGLTAAGLKSAAKSVAVEKIKEGARAAPGAIFNAAGGNRIPLLRHGMDLFKTIRDKAKADSELKPDDTRDDKSEKVKEQKEKKTEKAKAKRERDEDKNEKRQDKAEAEGTKHQQDVATSTLKLISRDINDIKEYILQPKKAEAEKQGLLGKLFAGLAGIIGMIPGAAAALSAAAAGGIAKITAMVARAGGLVSKLGAPAEVAAGAAKLAAPAATASRAAATGTELVATASKASKGLSAAGIAGKAAGVVSKIPGAKLLGRVAAPLAMGAAGLDIAKNGANVGNVGDLAAGGALMAGPVAAAGGAGWAAGRALDEFVIDKTETGRNFKRQGAKRMNWVANLVGMGGADMDDVDEANRKADAENARLQLVWKAQREAKAAGTLSAGGSGGGGGLGSQTPSAIPKLTSPKLPPPPTISSATDLNGKSAVELLSELVKAATTPDEGIYVKNGVKIIQSKEKAAPKPNFDGVQGGSQSTYGAPQDVQSSSLSVPTNREYTPTEMAVMASSQNAGKKAGIEPVDLPDQLGSITPAGQAGLPSTNPASPGKASGGAFRFGGGHDEAITEAAQKIGIREDILRGMIKQEGGTTGKVSPTGYYGSGQFRKAAWDTVANSKEGREAGIKPLSAEQDALTAKYRGKTLPSEIAAKDPRSDPRQSAMATAIYAKINARTLGKPVSQMTGEEIYLAHNMGAGGLKKLKAGNASQRDIMANTGGKQMSSHEFLAWQSNNFNRNAQKANKGWSFDSNGMSAASPTAPPMRPTMAGGAPTMDSIPPLLRAPPSQQGEAVYAANRKAEAKASAPIVVQGGPTIVQGGGGGKSRNSSRGGQGAQTAMVTHNPDPAIRQTILGWLARAV